MVEKKQCFSYLFSKSTVGSCGLRQRSSQTRQDRQTEQHTLCCPPVECDSDLSAGCEDTAGLSRLNRWCYNTNYTIIDYTNLTVISRKLELIDI